MPYDDELLRELRGAESGAGRLAQSAEERFGAVLRALGLLLVTIGGDGPRGGDGAERASAHPPAAAPPPARTPLPQSPRAGSAPRPPGAHGVPATDVPSTAAAAADVELILEDARERAHRIIDDSVAQARELLGRGADPAIAAVQQSLTVLTGEVRDIRARLERIESLLRGAGAGGASAPAAARPAPTVAPPAAPMPPPPAAAAAASRLRAGDVARRLRARLPAASRGSAAARAPRLRARRVGRAAARRAAVSRGAARRAAVSRGAARGRRRAAARAHALRRSAGSAARPPPPAAPREAAPVEPAPRPSAPPPPTPFEPGRGEPLREAVGQNVPPAAPPAGSSYRPAEPPAGAPPPRAESPQPETEAAGDRFSPDAGSVTLRVSPVAGFQGLMRVQDALAHLGAVREATVEAYSQGEARLRLQLREPVTSTEIAAGLAGRLGQRAHVEGSSAAERTLRVALG